MFATVALNPAFDRDKKIGPHRLRTEVTAPQPSGQGIHQEQCYGGDDKQAGQVINFLRPDLDEEEIKTPAGKIDQDGLVRCVRATIPTDERQKIIDAECDDEQRPFYSAKRATYMLRINFLARRIERLVIGIIGKIRFGDVC